MKVKYSTLLITSKESINHLLLQYTAYADSFKLQRQLGKFIAVYGKPNIKIKNKNGRHPTTWLMEVRTVNE